MIATICITVLAFVFSLIISFGIYAICNNFEVKSYDKYIFIICVIGSLFISKCVYELSAEDAAYRERINNVKSLVVEIPNITTCEGKVTSTQVICDNGIIYNNATYVIKDTIWKE